VFRRDASEPERPRACAVAVGSRTAKTMRRTVEIFLLVDIRGSLKP
jgi:hypothetical protein